ncbi:pyridine nucleotide-disulfide oxidoreductase [Prauserella marina]|nr:FAD-dependent oxidoreductase [Prauserella marina]ASR39274.1 pyridine nucleotide-disulfide oxidoreductase [Prauserella marina]
MSGVTPPDVLVVGASVAGLSTVEALRRKGYEGKVTVLGDEPHAPYDRPPLSKQVLSGAWEPERARLRRHDALSALAADFVLGDAATALDVGADQGSAIVHTAAGRTWSAGAVVVATGARPRPLPGMPGMPGMPGLAGVHLLRTLDDAIALRANLLTASRLVVVGDGVLGAEVAATATSMGLAVTLTGPQRLPMAGQLGTLVAARLAALHTARGVNLRLGEAVDGLVGERGTVTGVRLGGGEVIAADVVVAIGAIPHTSWLESSGLRLDDGLVCDEHCRAADRVYAVGDVARWRHEALGLSRLENRTNATEQARVVAAGIMGEQLRYAPVPYFWTDQFDVKIQVHGTLAARAEVTIVDGEIGEGRFVARYERDGAVTGVLGWNMPKQTRLRRQEILDSLTPAPGTSHREKT